MFWSENNEAKIISGENDDKPINREKIIFMDVLRQKSDTICDCISIHNHICNDIHIHTCNHIYIHNVCFYGPGDHTLVKNT